MNQIAIAKERAVGLQAETRKRYGVVVKNRGVGDDGA
jgi:hypothetical protein